MELLWLLSGGALMLIGITVGYRVARGRSPVAGPAEVWTNLKEFVKPTEPEKPPERAKPIQVKF